MYIEEDMIQFAYLYLLKSRSLEQLHGLTFEKEYREIERLQGFMAYVLIPCNDVHDGNIGDISNCPYPMTGVNCTITHAETCKKDILSN